MIKIVLTNKPLAAVRRAASPLAMVELTAAPLAILSRNRAALATINRESLPLATIKVPRFPHDPRELLDASGDWFMGADGQAVWGAN